MAFALEHLAGWGAALGVGLLIGLERQRDDGADEAQPGMRSFALAALAGALAQNFGEAALAAEALAVGALVVAGYVRARGDDPGITSELALLVTLLLGALSMRDPALGAALAVLVAGLLAIKARLHGFVRHALSADELNHLLLLAAAVLIVLPLLPDRPLRWLSGLNPHLLWLLAVLMMVIEGGAHVALRLFGAGRALLLAGLLGGVVSSMATVAAMGRRARAEPQRLDACTAAALASSATTVVGLGSLVAIVSPSLLPRLAASLGACALLLLTTTAWYAWRARGGPAGDTVQVARQPFSARNALLFAALVGAMLLLADLARSHLGDRGVLAAAVLAGFADAHATSTSAAQLHAQHLLDGATAARAIAGAFSSNALSKVVAAFITGSARYAWRNAAAQAALVAAFWAALALGGA